MSQLFKRGDVVQLKSGGPPMTVVNRGTKAEWDPEGDQAVYVVWRDDRGSGSSSFFDECLVPYPPIGRDET